MMWKRFLFALALAAMMAGPVLGGDGTWTNATEDDTWDTAGNWTGGVPSMDADVATFDGSEAALGLPTVNLPDLSAVALELAFTADYSAHDISEFSSAATCAAADLIIDSGGFIQADVQYGTAGVTAGGTLIIKAGTTVIASIINLIDGTLQAGGAGAVHDGLIYSPASGGTINWANLAVQGGIDAGGNPLTHQNTTGATLTCDQDGILDLGTDTANGIAVDVAADVTIGDDFTCYKFDGSSGVITGAAKTITVGSGGLTNGGATLDAVGTLNVIVAETPAAFDWAVANSNHSLGTLTVNAATTMTDTVYTTKVAGSAAIAIDARLYVRAMAADFWTNTATHSGSNRFVMYAYTGSHANTALINIGTCEFQVVGFDGTTTTLNGGLTCGVLDLNATAQNLVVNGPLSASGNTTLDDATLTLGSAATHSFGGTITSGSTGILIIDGTSTFAGAVDTTGITLTVAAASTVVFSDTLTIGDTATFTAGVTSFTADGFVLNATGKTLTGGGNTITVGAGGLTRTAGDLDAAGTLHVTFGDDVTTTVFVWASSPKPLGTITLGANSDVTLSGYAYLQKLSGGATATLNVADTVLRFKGATANLWDFDGTCTGGLGRVEFNGLSGDVTNAKIIDVGAADFRAQVANHTVTLSAGLVCDNLTVSGYGSGTGTLVLAGPLTVATNLALGEDAGNTDGILTMAAGEDNSIGGTVGTAGTGTGHELNLAGQVTFGDDVTGAEIAFDFGSVIIEASATLTIDLNNATSVANTDGTIFANGQTLTVSNVDYATTSAPIICVSCVDGTGNGVAVEFQEPQRTMMGVGF